MAEEVTYGERLRAMQPQFTSKDIGSFRAVIVVSAGESAVTVPRC